MRGVVLRYIYQPTGAYVQGPGNLNPAPAPALKLATQEPLSVTYLNAAGQPVLLTGPYLPYLGVKIQSEYDSPFVALSTPLAAPAAGSFAYTGTLNCNTTEFYAALGDTAGSMSAEADTVALMGEVVVQVDAEGNLARSQTFSITGQNRVVTGSEGVPVSANPAYPSAAAVIAAIAQAAAADTPAARNAAIAAALAALPAPVDTSNWPIQPASAFGQAVDALTNYAGPLYNGQASLALNDLTGLDPAGVISWMRMVGAFGATGVGLSLTGCLLPLAQEQALLTALTASSGITGISGQSVLDLSNPGDGPGNAPLVTPAQFTLDFSGVNVAAIIAGGVAVSTNWNALCAMSFDPTIPLSGSTSGFAETTLGVSDSPTPAQMAAMAASLPGVSVNSDGSTSTSTVNPANAAQVLGTDAYVNDFGDYINATDVATGMVMTVQNPGSLDPALLALQATGLWTVYHD